LDPGRLKLSIFENPEFLEPKSVAKNSQAKQHLIHDRKVAALKLLLRRIEAKKSDLLST